MALMDIIKKRYSCRNYESKPVEKEKLTKIFEAARLAPSARNFQDWRFVVITDRDLKAKLATVTNKPDSFKDAGALIVACSNSDHIMSCGQKVGPIDVSIALEHIALQATELGLATCWLGAFDPEKVREIVNIPKEIEIVDLMALGYPADQPKEAVRLNMDKIVCYNGWKF